MYDKTTMIPPVKKFNFALEHSEQEDESAISVTYGGESHNLLAEMNILSKKIIEHNTKELS